MNKSVRTRPLLADVVRVELRGAIVSGEYPLGSKLPNEDDLRDRFGVSRITLREAVGGLIEDGFVVRRQGSGTYVTHRPSLRNSLDTNFSYTEYLESAGIAATKRILSASVVKSDEDAAAALQIETGADVVEIRRIRLAGDRPAIYSIDSLLADVVDPDRDRDAFQGSLYQLLAARKRPIGHGEATIIPVKADNELAGILHVSADTPVQHIRQVDFDSLGVPVMHSLEWHVPAVMGLHVYRRGPGPISKP